jgi:hypothetical protein
MSTNRIAKPFAATSEGLIEDITSQLAKPLRQSADDVKAEIAGLMHADYSRALRQRLSRWEIREIVSEGRDTVWPELNKTAARLVTPREFEKHWAVFGLQFKFSRLSGEHGLSLMGFYSKALSLVGQKPLIWINTAHHPAIVGASLDHEMGHHVISQMFGLDPNVTHFLERNAFAAHLKDASELAADVLVSLCIYPSRVARELFGQRSRVHPGATERLFFKVAMDYIAGAYKLNFNASLEKDQKFYALAAVIYYTQLRRGLLAEYNI